LDLKVVFWSASHTEKDGQTDREREIECVSMCVCVLKCWVDRAQNLENIVWFSEINLWALQTAWTACCITLIEIILNLGKKQGITVFWGFFIYQCVSIGHIKMCPSVMSKIILVFYTGDLYSFLGTACVTLVYVTMYICTVLKCEQNTIRNHEICEWFISYWSYDGDAVLMYECYHEQKCAFVELSQQLLCYASEVWTK
jgi:hypothetical protein